MEKICCTCKNKLDLSFFSSEKVRRCRACTREHNRLYYRANRKQELARRKEWYASVREEQCAKARTYYYNNQERVSKRISAYTKKRYHEDSFFRLKQIIRAATRRGVRTKSLSTEQIVGCSYEHLKEHLESKFTSGMSWDNIGEWHIDHIVPLSSADTEEDLLKLGHYTNLQPLWAEDNLKKSSNII